MAVAVLNYRSMELSDCAVPDELSLDEQQRNDESRSGWAKDLIKEEYTYASLDDFKRLLLARAWDAEYIRFKCKSSKNGSASSWRAYCRCEGVVKSFQGSHLWPAKGKFARTGCRFYINLRVFDGGIKISSLDATHFGHVPITPIGELYAIQQQQFDANELLAECVPVIREHAITLYTLMDKSEWPILTSRLRACMEQMVLEFQSRSTEHLYSEQTVIPLPSYDSEDLNDESECQTASSSSLHENSDYEGELPAKHGRHV